MGKRQSTNLFKWLVIIGMLVSGAAAVVVGKLMYQTKSKGIHGDRHYFTKPWYQDWTMFIGMMLCLFGIRKPKTKESEPFLTTDDGTINEFKQPTPLKRLSILVMAPASCDLIATFLMNVGLLWLPGSVWQMFRSTIILFTALLAVVYRKHKLPKVDIFAVVVVVIGLIIVGIALLKSPEESSNGSSSVTLRGIGILLVIVSQFIQALQTIWEEQLLHDVDASEWAIVGFEGLWGFLFCIVFMIIAYFLPGDDGDGVHENTIDSFVMLGHSGVLIAFTLTYVVVILGYNILGMIITAFSSALLRNILEGIRPFLIWMSLVVIHYSAPDSGLGEKWTKWSWLELGGFLVTLFGAFIYNRVIKLPCFFYGNPLDKPINDGNDEKDEKDDLNDDVFQIDDQETSSNSEKKD
ncbi:hypothetical protein M0811_07578 [Anaeramoeba ignava]|uniref:Integral membrane protein n=1 Tax=Anaeramoeba ignava TaxID=1746090 RepID=A0A9Q0LNX0_ANAIG|nr:hypothetical protein M0811_07578 [Anaeramoeba ignava]